MDPREQDDEEARKGLVAGRTEALGNGLALGWGPRLGAGMQAGMAGVSGGNVGDTYNTALKENRQVLDRERKAEPKTATALEVTGGVPTTIATSGLGAGAKAAGFINRMRQALNTGGKLGLFTGAGNSEHDIGSLPHAADTVAGGVMGGLAGPAVEAVGGGVGKVTGLIRDYLKRPALAALRNEALASIAKSGTGDRIAGLAQGFEQQEMEKLVNEGATWSDQKTGFKHGPMSGMWATDLMWPGTDNVRVPMASQQEREFFEKLAKQAAKQAKGSTVAATGTKVDRPIADTAPKAETRRLAPEELQTILHVLSKAVE